MEELETQVGAVDAQPEVQAEPVVNTDVTANVDAPEVTENVDIKVNGSVKNYLNDLNLYNEQVNKLKEGQVKTEASKYVYVSEYDSYVNIENGETLLEKPEDYTEPVKNTGVPNVYDLMLEQNEVTKNNIQNKLVNQIYSDIDDTVENTFKDYGLSKEQISLLKSNVTDKLVTNFKLEHGGNLPTEQDVNNLYSTVSREIELTKTMFKLNEQMQDRVNAQKIVTEPLDTQNLTGIQGELKPQAPKNRTERQNAINEIAKKYTI